MKVTSFKGVTYNGIDINHLTLKVGDRFMGYNELLENPDAPNISKWVVVNRANLKSDGVINVDLNKELIAKMQFA